MARARKGGDKGKGKKGKGKKGKGKGGQNDWPDVLTKKDKAQLAADRWAAWMGSGK